MLSWILGGEEEENRAGQLAMGFGATGLGIATAAAPSSEIAASLFMNVAGDGGAFDVGPIIAPVVDVEDAGFVMMATEGRRSCSAGDDEDPYKNYRINTRPILNEDEEPVTFHNSNIARLCKNQWMTSYSPSHNKAPCYQAIRNEVNLMTIGDVMEFTSGMYNALFCGTSDSRLAAVLRDLFEFSCLPQSTYYDTWAERFAKIIDQDPYSAGAIVASAWLRMGRGDTSYRGQTPFPRSEMAAHIDYVLDLRGKSMVHGPDHDIPQWFRKNVAGPSSEREMSLHHSNVPDDVWRYQFDFKAMEPNFRMDALSHTLLNALVLKNPTIARGVNRALTEREAREASRA